MFKGIYSNIAHIQNIAKWS